MGLIEEKKIARNLVTLLLYWCLHSSERGDNLTKYIMSLIVITVTYSKFVNVETAHFYA